MFPAFKRMFAQSKRNGTILIAVSLTVVFFVFILFYAKYYILKTGRDFTGTPILTSERAYSGFFSFFVARFPFITLIKWIVPLYFVSSFLSNLREEKGKNVQIGKPSAAQKINWKPKIAVIIISVSALLVAIVLSTVYNQPPPIPH